jgi:hypothetical protein
VVTRAEVFALFDDGAPLEVLAHRGLYIEGTVRGGGTSGRERSGGIIVHKPAAAVLLPSDLPPLSWREPDFPSLRHVLVRFGFMLDRLPAGHGYESATLSISLDQPDAVVLAQHPSLVTTESETSGTRTTELSAMLNRFAKLGVQQTRVVQTTRRTTLPLITPENRGADGFGWHYQAQDGAPLLPHPETVRALIELPREVSELTGAISGEALVTFHRYGVFTRSLAAPLAPAVRFRLPLGLAHPAGRLPGTT